ncbi:hypothetical protein [Herpetosiphon llansteffanensis]|uniref:hypothetical protein n=1 Tax=Herpetosiphon llansteffanensis TaxID=2094568 RepID=UPI000D7BA867|nr:hypothetical protein [Herpetosiphon llansteffanensis]
MARPAASNPFFRTWSPTMAYVLGYWWADGMMRIKTNTGAHEIRMASNDLDHLEQLANSIGTKYHLRKVSQNSETFTVEFCSKEMYIDLLALGGTPRKSRTIGMPDVPDEYLSDFVRGVIDGDGTVGWNGDRPIVHLYSGSTLFLGGFTQRIESLTGIPAPNLIANRNNYYIKWSTIRARCLAMWLYRNNNGLMLARKAAIAQQFEQWQPKKSPERGTITEKMRLHFANYLP